MKIWIMNHYATDSTGAMWGRHYYLAQELTHKGYEVCIFASGYLHNQYRETREYGNKLFDTAIVNGVRYVWIKTFPYYGNDWRRVLNMISFALRLIGIGKNEPSPDVIIASSFHPLTWISGYKLAKMHRSRFIVEVRDLWPETPISMGVLRKNGFVARFLRGIEKFAYKKAERIITVLPDAYKYITSLGVESEKIVYIPNGADPDIYSKQDVENPEFKEFVSNNPEILDTSKFKVIYTGAHGVVNDLETAIRAAKTLQDMNIDNILFVFVGDGPEKEKLINLKNEMQLDNVKFCGPVSKKTVPEILSCADCCLILGKDLSVYAYGISPNKLFDYMAAGKPILITGNFPNCIVEQANCGIYIPPEEPEKLSGALVKLFQMPKNDLERMGENGKRYFMKHHTYQALAEKLVKEVIETSILIPTE